MPRRNRSKKSGQSVARKALALAKKANKTELKYIDASASLQTDAQNIKSTGDFQYNFPLISTGATVSTRVGNVIEAKSLNAKITFSKHASATASVVRVIMFIWKSDGAPSAVTDYLASASVNGQKAVDHRFDSKTLMDKTYVLDSDNPKKQLNLRKKLNFPIFYDTSGSTPDKNKLVILMISDETTNWPTFSGNLRLYFTDK